MRVRAHPNKASDAPTESTCPRPTATTARGGRAGPHGGRVRPGTTSALAPRMAQQGRRRARGDRGGGDGGERAERCPGDSRRGGRRPRCGLGRGRPPRRGRSRGRSAGGRLRQRAGQPGAPGEAFEEVSPDDQARRGLKTWVARREGQLRLVTWRRERRCPRGALPTGARRHRPTSYRRCRSGR